MSYADCAVVIVTYNSARHIGDLLASLPDAAAGLTMKVIVVDNGSRDDTVARIRAHSDVTCVEAGDNLGYSGGINVGRRHAGDYGALAVLNPDLVLDPGSLREMFGALGDRSVGVVVPMILNFEGRLELSLRREPTLLTEIGDALFAHHFRRAPARLTDLVGREREYGYRHVVDWASGAALLVSHACDRQVGAWDERFFLYMEEVDYAARVRAAGFRVMYEPLARVRHLGGGSSQSPLLVALMAVSRVRYFEKHGRRPRMLRAVVGLNQLLRSGKPNRRLALRTVARRSAWEPLIAGLKNSEGA